MIRIFPAYYRSKLRSYNSPTLLAYALIAPAAIYLLCIVAWPLIETIRFNSIEEDKFLTNTLQATNHGDSEELINGQVV